MDTSTSRDTDYTLSLDHVAARYAAAGRPRTLRTLQRYCASGHLDSQKIATATGDKYLVTPQSVERHIAQINELGSLEAVATGRAAPRPVATQQILKGSQVLSLRQGPTVRDRRRQKQGSRRAQYHPPDPKSS